MKFSSIARKDYFIKQYIIYSCLLFVLVFLSLYHFNKVIIQLSELNPIISFLSQFSLDFSIILIPAVLSLANIRKNFRKKFNNLFSMKEKILHLRDEIAQHFTKIHDKVEVESFVLEPIIINEIKSHLRDFKLSHYADIFDDIILRKSLYNLDQLLFEVIKLTRTYDDDKFFNYLKNNWESTQILKKLKELFKKVIILPSEEDLIKEKFNKNVLWPIVYEFFFDTPNKYPDMVFYYEISEILS
ncbi:MAG: hypothetical protein ACFE9S_17775 [Candidatus Hermodarchaeota archaeon]